MSDDVIRYGLFALCIAICAAYGWWKKDLQGAVTIMVLVLLIGSIARCSTAEAAEFHLRGGFGTEYTTTVGGDVKGNVSIDAYLHRGFGASQWHTSAVDLEQDLRVFDLSLVWYEASWGRLRVRPHVGYDWSRKARSVTYGGELRFPLYRDVLELNAFGTRSRDSDLMQVGFMVRFPLWPK